jgi:hypothetical protein
MFDRDAYERAIKQMDEALTPEDYSSGLCALMEAQGRVPRLSEVARAFGLPPPDRAAIKAFEEDVIHGRIPSGTTAAEVRKRFYGAGSSRPRRSPSCSEPRRELAAQFRATARERSRSSPNGDGPLLDDGRWTKDAAVAADDPPRARRGRARVQTSRSRSPTPPSRGWSERCVR